MQILIDNIEYILTLDRSRRVIHNGSIVVNAGKIVRVGKKNDIDREFARSSFDRVIDGLHNVATPGFIDTHIHTHEHLSKGLFPDYINTGAWTAEWAYPFYGITTEQDEYTSAVFCCAEMLKTGTTCFLDSGARFPKSVAEAADKIGIRGIVGRRVMDNPPQKIPSKWSSDLLDELYFSSPKQAMIEIKKTLELGKSFGNKRIRAWVTINGKDTCTDELYLKAWELSNESKVGMHFHSASSLKEAQESQKKRGMWPISYLNKLGVLKENVVIAHATMVADSEIKLIAENNAKISFCPGSALKLAKGAGPYGKYPELLKAGAVVSLGCDGTSAAGSFDMVRQVYLSSGIFKDSRLDESMIPAEQALEMGTLLGARALQWEDEIGSIEEGKSADVVIFNGREFEWLPLNDPVQNLVYSASGNSVTTVLVDGVIVVDNKKLTRIDEDELLSQVDVAAKEMKERSGLKPPRSWNYV